MRSENAYPTIFLVQTLKQIGSNRIAMFGVYGALSGFLPHGMIQPFHQLVDTPPGAGNRRLYHMVESVQPQGTLCLPVLPVRLAGGGSPAAFSQLRSVSMQIPSSATTSLLGRPCSVTNRRAPSLNFSSYLRGAMPSLFPILFFSFSFHYTDSFSVFQDGKGTIDFPDDFLGKLWDETDWQAAKEILADIQKQIALAAYRHDDEAITALQKQLVRRMEIKQLAVQKICGSNSGLGVDGVKWKESGEKIRAALMLTSKGVQAKPMRDIIVKSKSTGRERTYGLPTYFDRVMQVCMAFL